MSDSNLPILFAVGVGMLMLTDNSRPDTGPGSISGNYRTYGSPSRSGNYSPYYRVNTSQLPRAQQPTLIDRVMGLGVSAAAGKGASFVYNKASDFITGGGASVNVGGIAANTPMDYGAGIDFASSSSAGIAGQEAASGIGGIDAAAAADAAGFAADAEIGSAAADAAAAAGEAGFWEEAASWVASFF